MNQPSIFPWEDDARREASEREQDMFDETLAADYHPPATPDTPGKAEPPARPPAPAMAPTAADQAANDEGIGAPFASRDRSQPRFRRPRPASAS